MAYTYYQNSGIPGWGTTQFQFGAPPVPAFQPQPTWGGYDYYRAHAGESPDLSLYERAWDRARDYRDYVDGGIGVGMHEARHWHRRAYGGLGDINQMHPHEIGHAAAYEAYRTWIHNSSIYEPLSGDSERQREGLIGLAIAEVSRLIQCTLQGRDYYAMSEASEAAAATASILFYNARNREDEYRGRTGYAGSYGDPYEYDSRAFSRARSYSLGRGRSASRHRLFPGTSPSSYAGSTYSADVPIPSVSPSYSSSSYGGSYGSYGSPYGSHFAHPSALTLPMQTAAYPTTSVPVGYTYSQSSVPLAASYGQMPMVIDPRHRSSMSMSYPYPQTQYMGVPAQTPSQIILSMPSKSSHRSRHSSRHSKRSHSSGHH